MLRYECFYVGPKCIICILENVLYYCICVYIIVFLPTYNNLRCTLFTHKKCVFTHKKYLVCVFRTIFVTVIHGFLSRFLFALKKKSFLVCVYDT